MKTVLICSPPVLDFENLHLVYTAQKQSTTIFAFYAYDQSVCLLYA